MPSNDLDVIVKIDKLYPEIKVQNRPPRSGQPTRSLSTRRQSGGVVTNGDSAKAVPVSGAKRRKVAYQETPPAGVGRRAKFGVRGTKRDNSLRQNAKTSDTAEDIKESRRTLLTTRLQETYQTHDTKLRELFHLTKFISLVDYDPDAAKEDESEVFRDVSPHFLSTNYSSRSRSSCCRRRLMRRLVDESGQPAMR
jgi:hypothetical protein